MFFHSCSSLPAASRLVLRPYNIVHYDDKVSFYSWINTVKHLWLPANGLPNSHEVLSAHHLSFAVFHHTPLSSLFAAPRSCMPFQIGRNTAKHTSLPLSTATRHFLPIISRSLSPTTLHSPFSNVPPNRAQIPRSIPPCPTLHARTQWPALEIAVLFFTSSTTSRSIRLQFYLAHPTWISATQTQM